MGHRLVRGPGMALVVLSVVEQRLDAVRAVLAARKGSSSTERRWDRWSDRPTKCSARLLPAV